MINTQHARFHEYLSVSATEEGWGLFQRDDGYYEIERDDDSDTFETDTEALEHVFQQALIGDPKAILALYLDGTRTDKQFIPEWMPVVRERHRAEHVDSITTKNNIELEIFECPIAGAQFGIDATFLEQVIDIVPSPYNPQIDLDLSEQSHKENS